MGLFGNKERKYWRRYEEAFRYYENRQITRAIKSVMNPAADGFAPAQHLMGILRIEREMYDDAEYWLTNALKNGHTQAQADLNYLHNEVLKKKEQPAAKAEEKQPAEAQEQPAPQRPVQPQPEAAQPRPALQKTERQLRAEIEAELRKKMEAELAAKIEAELTAKLEAEKRQKAKIQENAEKTVTEARNFCARGDIDTAEKMLAELLAEMPDFRSAQLLMEEIQDVRAWEKEKAEKEAAERERAEMERLKARLRARIDAKVKAEMEAEEAARRQAEEKAEKAAAEKARFEAELKARLEAEEKARREAAEKARAEAEAKAAAEEKARIEETEKAKGEAVARAEEKQPAGNGDEAFTPQRLALMEAIAAKGREKQRKLKEENRDHWADELDKIEELYRSGDYKHAFLQASMYEEASARAINMMGAMYLTGRGTEKDLVKAKEYFERARRLDYIPARYNRAMLQLSTGGDENKVLQEMEALADEGHLPSMAQAGQMYLDGIGTSESESDGWLWLCIAACNGDMDIARRIVQLFYDQPEKVMVLRAYLNELCKAGDTELTVKMARLFANGIPGKMTANLTQLSRCRDILEQQGYKLDDVL